VSFASPSVAFRDFFYACLILSAATYAPAPTLTPSASRAKLVCILESYYLSIKLKMEK